MSIKARERILNVLIFLGIIALLFVVGYPQYKESLPSQIKIGVDKSFASVPFYVAEEDTSRQYFVIEKIEPEFVEVTGDPLQGLKDGLYDIVAVPWYNLLLSPAIDGDTVKVCASLELRSGKLLDAIIVPEKSKIRRLGHLKGKRLGYLKQDEYIVDLILSQLAEKEKITRVKKVLLEPEQLATAFTNKEVDAVYLIDPYRGYMLYQGNKILFEGLISMYIISSSFPYTAIVMRKSYVKEENKLAGIRLKNALDATLSYITRNPEICKKVIIKINNWPHKSELVHNIRTPEYQRLAEINLKNVENLQTKLVKLGIGTCGIKPNEFLFDKLDFVR